LAIEPIPADPTRDKAAHGRDILCGRKHRHFPAFGHENGIDVRHQRPGFGPHEALADFEHAVHRGGFDDQPATIGTGCPSLPVPPPRYTTGASCA
jgi:hypothetical protein